MLQTVYSRLKHQVGKVRDYLSLGEQSQTALEEHPEAPRKDPQDPQDRPDRPEAV